jgi:hypothetical protein
MRILAIVIFVCSMAMVAVSLEGCAHPDIHPSTPNLKWQD